MTIRELAKLANVSPGTVSKAFNNATDISAETREHIFELAKKHGCFGKFSKNKYPKRVIAIICPEISSAFYYDFVAKLQKRFEQMNCITVISTTDFDSSKQSELINYYSSYLQVDGIIVFGLQSTLKKGYDTPFINLGYSSIENVDCVHSELYPAVLDAVKYLKDNGHSKIACISEKLTSGKLDLIRRACTENGLQINPDDIVVCTERFENAGKLGIQKLLKENTQATAIFCTYDYIALGAIKQLFDNGYSVPEDFSVIGMDNINEAKYLNKSLTTIDSHIDRQCQIICNLMKKKLENRFFQLERSVILNSDLIIRDTVCRNKDCYK